MTNREKAALLRSAASALEHGRIHTANAKLHKVFRASELFDLLDSDIYTDAYEYASRVDRIRELLGDPNYYGTWTTIEADD